MKSKNKKYDKEARYFLNPNTTWSVEDGELVINQIAYDAVYISLFPQIFEETKNGILLGTLIEKLEKINCESLSFIEELIENRVLVDALLNPRELFSIQERVFENKYSLETFINSKTLEEFKKQQLNRSVATMNAEAIPLVPEETYAESITQRQTCRTFDTTTELTFGMFSELISVFRQYKQDGNIRYNYASAGGLYPIDIYIYVKDHRVEKISGGLYYYSPINNEIKLVSSSCVITEDAHFYGNKEIYNGSAFSIFFIYNGEASMPKYGGMGNFYACIDTGIMVGLLTQIVEQYNIGMCSIGDMNFDRIKKYFKLNKNQMLLHTVEIGLKK